MLSLCSNDYLGLASHPALAAAATAAAARDGFGASAARLVSGDLPAHRELEAALSSFLDRPAALVFPTGYQANLGVLTALAGRDDLIVSDALNHASLIDGCRLSRARVEVYPHGDAEAAARLLSAGGPVPAPAAGDRIAVQHGRGRRPPRRPRRRPPPRPTASWWWTRPTPSARWARADAASARPRASRPRSRSAPSARQPARQGDSLPARVPCATCSSTGPGRSSSRPRCPRRSRPRPPLRLRSSPARKATAGGRCLADRQRSLGEALARRALVAGPPAGPILPVVLG